MDDLEVLSKKWLILKSAEADAVEERRIIEDKMLSLIGISGNNDGTTNAEAGGAYKIKVVSRINRKVDTSLVQEIAAEHGTSNHLSTLFRWTAAIDSAAWKAADNSITKPLLDAITATPGRPSFSIDLINKE